MSDTGVPPASSATPAQTFRAPPRVRTIDGSDLAAAIAAGLADFRAAPLLGAVFGAVYAVGGLAIVLSALGAGMGWLAYPLAAGFSLIGPFVAVGCYEISRRRELGLPLAWRPIFGAVFDQGGRELGWMAFVTLFVFIVWMYQIRMLLVLCLGFQNFTTVHQFLDVVVSTPEGLLFLALGHLDGAVLSLVVFSLTVVSFPLLLDREVDFVTAMITSVSAVTTNPRPMIAWALIVVGSLILAMLPAFLGLIVVLPILGHVTWHLYRRLVEPEQITPLGD